MKATEAKIIRDFRPDGRSGSRRWCGVCRSRGWATDSLTAYLGGIWRGTDRSRCARYLHCGGGLRAGLGVLGYDEHHGGELVGASNFSRVIAGGEGGCRCPSQRRATHIYVCSEAVRFDSLNGLNAEVRSSRVAIVIEKQSRRAIFERMEGR